MKLPYERILQSAGAIVASLLLMSAPPAITAEPVNEDEWYDPGDWFDGNNKESDDTWGTAGAEWNQWRDWNDLDTWETTRSPWVDYDYDDYSYGGTYPYWRDNYNQNRRTDRNQQNQTALAGKSRSVAGTVEGFREVDVRSHQGQRDQFTVARIRLRDGRSITVDLGRRLTLQDLDLNKGDYVSVTGKSRTIGGQNVLLADYIYADGQEHRISRGNSGRQQGSTARSESSQSETAQDVWSQDRNRVTSSQTLRGTVESFRRVNLTGAESGHTLARLNMEDGNSMIVDFGPRQTPASLGINRGDYVSVRGNQTTISNRPILRAQSVFSGGSWRNIQSDAQRSETQVNEN